MKEYFSHDYNSRNDPKLVKLQMKIGISGLGVYWCIIEMLYEEGGYLLRNEYERITFELRTDYELIKSVIDDFDLFKNDGVKFWSESALNRLNERANKSEKARQSINKRWEKYERNTNVIPTLNEGNTIKVKESKVKESKVKENIAPEILEIDFKNWRSDYKIYFKYLISELEKIKNDGDWILMMRKANPTFDISKSLDRSVCEYWGTEKGWETKKSTKSKMINWKGTFAKTIHYNSVLKTVQKLAM
jgi:hypothetical protein